MLEACKSFVWIQVQQTVGLRYVGLDQSQRCTSTLLKSEAIVYAMITKFNNRLWYRTQYSKLQQILSLSSMQRKYKPPSSKKQVAISPSADNNKHIKTENNNNKFERKIEDDAMQGPKKNFLFCKDLT